MSQTVALSLVPFTLLSVVLPAQEPAKSQPASRPAPVLLGTGTHTYRWVDGWGRLPDGRKLGNTHGCMVVDGGGRIYFNTDTENAVCVFEPGGKFVKAWGKKLAAGLHGMALVGEGGREFLYLSHIGRSQVFKATLDGEILWTLDYPKEAGVYENARQFRPTAVAVGPDGDIYVADGYGKSWVHQFDKDRNYIRSWGGRGTEPGKFRTPHGLWIDTRGKEPRLVVADRENHRLQLFDLEGELIGVVEGMFRRPCSLYQHGKNLVVADLAGRVTILDEKNELVTHLGDNPDPKMRAKNDVPPAQWKRGEFLSPHSACWDRDGDLYVMDWNRLGRVTKLARVAPASRPTSGKR